MDLEADSLHRYREKVCLVQVSSRTLNLVIDPLACRSALGFLEGILADRGIRKVLHGADYDVRLLKKDFGLEVRNIFDTMVAARLAGRAKFGLAALLEEQFGVLLDKRFQQADWSARPLSEDLINYAALDTAWLIPLREKLEEELERLGRLSWALEEFRLLEGAEPAPERGPSAWDVKGAGLLTAEQRGFLQRLVEIRDGAARKRDRPPFKIVSNKVLLSWVESPPRGRREVIETKGASKGNLALLAQEVVETFRRPLSPGEALEPAESSGTPLTEGQRRILKRLKEVRVSREQELGLPAGILVNSATLERISRMGAEEAGEFIRSGLKSWQREVIGDDLERTLSSFR